MAGVRVTLRTNQNSAGIGKSQREVIEEVLEEAAAEGLRAALLLVPVDSGESKGAFRKIGTRIKVDFPISPRRKVKGKNPQTGSRKSEFEISISPDLFRLKFSTTVWQLENLSFGLRAFAEFKDAATAYIRRELPPRLKKAIMLELSNLLE